MVGIERKQLERRITVLEDRLRNGIKYDEENNQYILVWTKKELDEAREEAHKLAEFFGTLEVAKDE